MSTFDYELQPQWQPGYIVLSYVIATLGSGLVRINEAAYGRVRKKKLDVAVRWFNCTRSDWNLVDALYCGHSVPMAFTPGLTVLSALLPIVIIAAGFLIAGDPNRPKIWKNFLAGCAGGIGVSVMHYIGMLSMVIQVRTEWNGSIIFASVMVGIVAATAAMFIFFRFGKLWRSDLRLQAATSGVMGVAVCGMHYTGMQSIKFYSSLDPVDLSSYATRDQILTTILSLTSLTLIILVGLRIYYRALLRLELEKSQCLTLQVILLDSTGSHIYVGPTGAPPSAIIEKAYVGSGELNQANQNFLRMFRTSFNWKLMERHLQQLQQAASINAKRASVISGDVTPIEDSIHTPSSSSTTRIDSSVIELYSKFVTAVKELSAQLNIPIELFGKIYFEPYNSLIYIVFEPTSLFKSDTTPILTPMEIGGSPDVTIDISSPDRANTLAQPIPLESLPNLPMKHRRLLSDQLQKAGTSFRFQEISHIQKELKQYLRLEASDGEPQQWLNKLREFYKRVTMPMVATTTMPTMPTTVSPTTDFIQLPSPSMSNTRKLQVSWPRSSSPQPSTDNEDDDLIGMLMKVGENCQISQEELKPAAMTWLATLRSELLLPGSTTSATDSTTTRTMTDTPSLSSPTPPVGIVAPAPIRPLVPQLSIPIRPRNNKLNPDDRHSRHVSWSNDDYITPLLPSRIKSVNDLCKFARHPTWWTGINLPANIKTELSRVLNEPVATTVSTARETTQLHVALYYSQASGFKGLQVMVPSAGPYAMIPTQPFSLIENEVPISDARMLLKDLMSVAHRQALDEEVSSNIVDGATNIQLALKQVGGTRSTLASPLGTARLGAESSVNSELPATGVTVGLHQPDSTTTHTPAVSLAPMLHQKKPSSSNLGINNPNIPPSMVTLRTNFFGAARQLSQSVGSKAEFVLANLHPTLVEVTPGCHMIVFVVCKLSPIIPDHLKKFNLFMPLAMFEIIHQVATTSVDTATTGATHSTTTSPREESESGGHPSKRVIQRCWTRTLLTTQLLLQPTIVSPRPAWKLESEGLPAVTGEE